MSLLAVNHHYYREVSPPGGFYPINRARLLAEVGLLRKRRRPISQKELLDALADPGQMHDLSDTFILTFDDGLKEQMAALHALESIGIAALFFVPTAPLTERRVLDVHKLHLIRAARADADLVADLEKLFPKALSRMDMAAAARQYRYDNDVARRVKYLLNFLLDPNERRDWIDRVFKETVGREADVADTLYMDRDDIRSLAQFNMLGAHGHSHRPLATMDTEVMVQDVALSTEILADMGGQAVKGISFPYGGPTAVSDSVVEVCAASGLSFGFTMQRGCNQLLELQKPMRLKRIDCNDVAEYA